MPYENANIETLARGVLVRDGKLLVCQPKKGGRCYLPGGHVEFGETARQALVREVREEMSLRAEAGDFLAVAENTFTQNGEPHCEVNLVFRLDIPGLTAETDPAAAEDWIAFRWIPFDADALHAANLLPEHLIADLPTWLATPGFHAEDGFAP